MRSSLCISPLLVSSSVQRNIFIVALRQPTYLISFSFIFVISKRYFHMRSIQISFHFKYSTVYLNRLVIYNYLCILIILSYHSSLSISQITFLISQIVLCILQIISMSHQLAYFKNSLVERERDLFYSLGFSDAL